MASGAPECRSSCKRRKETTRRPSGLQTIIVSVALGLCVSAVLGRAGGHEGVVAYKQGDFATAVREFLPLAERGDMAAQFYLAAMYSKGWGVPQDDTAAAQWYQRAAAQGLAEAQFNLGWLYIRGQGVPRDLVQAYRWLELATRRFPSGASHDKAVHARDVIAAQMTPTQLAQAQALVSQWQPQQAP